MKKRKNIARIEKEKCGKMGNLIENVFRLKKYSEREKCFREIEDLKQKTEQIINSTLASIINPKTKEKIKNKS